MNYLILTFFDQKSTDYNKKWRGVSTFERLLRNGTSSSRQHQKNIYMQTIH
jgi:hypothetical protein